MVVEFLTFTIPPDDQDGWLAHERAVWSEYLATVPGFVRKEIWRSPRAPGIVHAVIWWASREAWNAVTPEMVASVDARMGEWYRPAQLTEYSVVRSV